MCDDLYETMSDESVSVIFGVVDTSRVLKLRIVSVTCQSSAIPLLTTLSELHPARWYSSLLRGVLG